MDAIRPARPWEFAWRMPIMLLSIPVTALIAGGAGIVEGAWYAPVVWWPVLAASACLSAAGLCLRVWGTAVLTPASMLRNTARGDVLIDEGPFSQVRNPLYLGTQLIIGGWSLWYGWRVAVPFVLFHAFRFHRIVLYEEALLRRDHPAAFAEYEQRVPRWIPLRRPAGTAGAMHCRRATPCGSMPGAVLSNGPLGGMVAALLIAAVTRQTQWLFPGMGVGLLASQVYFAVRRRNQAAPAPLEAAAISEGSE